MSFMKQISRIAAPFASLIPGAGPFIGAGLSVIGSLSSGSKKSAASGMDPQLLQRLLAGYDQSNAMGKASFDKGMPLIDQGTGGINKAMGVYGDMAAGKGNALAGPIADLTIGNNRQMQNMAQFGPRGGGTNAAMANRSPQLSNDIARLRFSGIQQGAQGLVQGGSALLGGGTNLVSSGQQGVQGGLSTLLGIRGQDISQQIARDQISAQNQAGLGQGIGSLLGILLGPGGILNKGAGSGSLGNIFGGSKGSGMPGVGGKF